MNGGLVHMQSNNLKYWSQTAVFVALTVVLGYIKVPTATGFLSLLDVGVYAAAFYFGGRQGALVGGLGGFLLDLLLGYPQWSLFSLVAHGGQGRLAQGIVPSRWLSGLLSSLFMVAVYAGASSLMYGPAAALPEVIPNFLQSFLGFLLAQVLVGLLRRKDG